MHVLILGARAPACLEWARAFATAGWKVTVADSLRWPAARASNAAGRYQRLPEPRTNPDEWIAALLHTVETGAVDMVLPTCEEVFYLARGLAQLPCRVMTIGLPTLHTLHHKYRFSNMVRDWSCSTPETHLIESTTDMASFTDRANEWVFKPAYSRFAARTLIRPNKQELKKVHPDREHPWVAQRFVSGEEYCSYSLLVRGRLTAHACYHPRYRVGQGSGIWFKPADSSVIRAFVERFGKTTGYSGQVAFDFIDAEDGQWHVLECNPRATSGVHLFDDQAKELVQALLGDNSEDQVLTPTSHPRMVGLAMLLFALPRHFWRKQFWQDLTAASDVIVRAGDWGPLLAQIPGLLEIMGRALARRHGLLSAATADIEWDGQPMGSSKPCN